MKNKQDLNFEESKSAFESMMSGKIDEKQIIDFLSFSSAKGETSNEIAGGVYVLRDKATIKLMCQMIQSIHVVLVEMDKIL